MAKMYSIDYKVDRAGMIKNVHLAAESKSQAKRKLIQLDVCNLIDVVSIKKLQLTCKLK